MAIDEHTFHTLYWKNIWEPHGDRVIMEWQCIGHLEKVNRTFKTVGDYLLGENVIIFFFQNGKKQGRRFEYPQKNTLALVKCVRDKKQYCYHELVFLRAMVSGEFTSILNESICIIYYNYKLFTKF